MSTTDNPGDNSSTKLLASVYNYADPALDTLLLQVSQQFDSEIATEDNLKGNKESSFPTAT